MPKTPWSVLSFQALGLPEFLLRATQNAGFAHPTPIQAEAIPLVVAGGDLAAEAQTGSGKTAAFVLPLLQQVGTAFAGIQVLVVEPTRELAHQVRSVFSDLGAFSPRALRVLAVVGGDSIDAQCAELEEGCDVVVATPGRLLDLLAHQQIDLSLVKTLVLDEADKLLDADFRGELDTLLAAMPSSRQTLLFSATLPPAVLAVCEQVLRNPSVVRIDTTHAQVDAIEQRVYSVDRDQRRALLQELLRAEGWSRTLVFVATQRQAQNLAAKLSGAGLMAGALHGGMFQDDRTEMLKRFHAGELSILVATDLASRGIDVPLLSTVVNFDLPRATSTYIHRIGRTGRAGATGLAVSFIDHASAPHFRLIEQRCAVEVKRCEAPGFVLRGPAPARAKGAPPVKGKRKSKKDKKREELAKTSSSADSTGSDASNH